MTSPSFNVPILLLTFNRLECTLKVFEAVRRVRPKKIYIASDGPRSDVSSDKLDVQKVRLAVEQKIDWPCDIERLYRDENLGCKRAVVEAIDWFFVNEPCGIVLEDDCVPSYDFFDFCKKALDELGEDKTISMITGSRFTPSNQSHLSKYCMIWGWATWRDRWHGYKSELQLSQQSINEFGALFSGGRLIEKLYWRELLGRLNGGKIPSAWDFQFLYHSFMNGRVSLVPPVNLISNIGVGDLATNNQNTSRVNNIPTERLDISDITFDHLKVSLYEDKLTFKLFFCNSWITMIKRYLRAWLKKH